MTADKLEAIRERCGRRNDSFDGRDEFVRHARTDVPALLDEVERLTVERDAARTELLTLSAWHPHSAVGMLRLVEAEKERDDARTQLGMVEAWHEQMCRSSEKGWAEVERLTRERDNALAKAEAHERDWRDAKSEFGSAMEKMRAALRAAEKRELEALAELDEARALLREVAEVCRGLKAPTDAVQSVIGPVLRERDEARAGAKRVAALESPMSYLPPGEERLRALLAICIHERDEARAEVERLRSKAIRFDLDQHGIEQRESDAVALVEARAEVERLRKELQVERCGVRPIDELLQRVTTDRDELHVAWKREREEVERLTRERDGARDKILEYTDALVERDAEIEHLKRDLDAARLEQHRACHERFCEVYDRAKKAERERDDAIACLDRAEAEAERLKAKVLQLTDLNATQSKTLDALFAEAERLRAILGGGGFTYSEGETALRAQLASALRDAKRFADERDELRERLVIEQSR